MQNPPRSSEDVVAPGPAALKNAWPPCWGQPQMQDNYWECEVQILGLVKSSALCQLSS